MSGSATREAGSLFRIKASTNRLRVLLVEDEQQIRDLVVPWLLEDGFDCREAADGRAAMHLLTSGTRVDLVLSNMLLPMVDGFTLLMEVKERLPRMSFAFVTAVDDEGLREEAMLKGADGYLLKPFSRDEFLDFIRRVISENRDFRRGHDESAICPK